MVELTVVHVAVAPPDVLDNTLVGTVAVILGKDNYNTRLLLAGKIPKIIAHYNSLSQAEIAAKNLRELNLKAIVFEDSALRRPSESFRAYTAQFGSQEISFGDRCRQKISLSTGNVFLMLKGIVSTSRELETTTTKTKINIPLTVMTGGIPIMRKVKEQNKGVTFREEYFLRLYSRESAEHHIEILQNDFDYSTLGSQMGSSSLSNFNLLVTNLIKVFTSAFFDDKLTKYSNPNTTSNTLNNVEVNCRLLYSFYRLTDLV